jgi:Flp pilus assembly protein TadD
MFKSAFKRGRLPRLVVVAASSAVLAFGLCGCQTTAISDITGSLGDKAEASASSGSHRDIDALRERYKANPQDPVAALAYGRALRANGERSQAVAVLEQAALANPKNKPLLAGYGRALADNGNFQQAFDVLTQAHTPEDPDWRIL